VLGDGWYLVLDTL